MLSNRFPLSTVAASVALVVGGVANTNVYAQGANEIEEVVVTARKREEALVDVPVSISVFSADQLDRGGFQGLQDLSFQTPGLQYNSQGGQIPGRFNTSVRFRGMDTNQSAASQQLGTVFLDGVYMSHGIQGIDFSNIERVEIIKGPQSATFGRSTFAGAVNYISKTPGDEFAGTVIADVSDYGGRDVSFAHEGPITDTLAYRVSLRSYGTDGQYISNADGGALGEESTDTIMGTLFWSPTDNLSVKFRYMWSQDDDGPAAGMLLGTGLSARASGSANAGPNCYSQGVTSPATSPADYFCGALPKVDVDNFISPNTNIPPAVAAVYRQDKARDARTGIVRPNAPGAPLVDYMGLKRYQRRAALFIDYDFDDGVLDGYTLSTTIADNVVRSNWIRDFDLTAANNFISQDPAQFEDTSIEVTLESPGDNRFRWSIGVNYFEGDTTTVGNGGVSHWDVDGGIGFDPTYSASLGAGPHTNKAAVEPVESNETLGIFGALSYDFTEDLTLDFEWRFQEDDISQQPFDGSGTRFADSFDSFLPRITLSYNVMDRGTVWGTYSEGNIPGFINSDFASLTDVDRAAVLAQVPGIGLFNEEEELENFEIGFKQQYDNGVYFSAVWYTMDWTNLKTRQPIRLVDQFGATRVLNLQFNAGGAELDGIEVEGGFGIGDNFDATFSLNWADGEYTTLQCGFSPFKEPITPGDTFGPRDCSGSRPARYPEWSGSFSGTYTNTLPSGNWDYFVRLDGEYFGEAFSEEANFSTHGEFWRFNLRGGFEKEGLRLEGYVRNLFDNDDYLAAARWSDFSAPFFIGFLFSQGVATTPAQKRTIGFKAVYEF